MQELLLVAGIHLLAVMSPGPDFAMVMRNSLVYSRRTGILAATGLGLGILLHVTYSLLGIGLIISQSILLFNTIKLLGAAYLIYIGVKSLLSKRAGPSDETIVGPSSQKDISSLAAVRLGFLTNALNPKATLFFLALFTQVISPSTPLSMKLLYGAEMSIATFAWFAFVATVLTHKRVSNIFTGVRQQIERVFGVILVALGIKVALGTKQS
jgi:RhtB (resistance to homoserine/threonine) family protein